MIRWIQNVSKKWLVTTIAVIAVIAVVGVAVMNGFGGKLGKGAQPSSQQQRPGGGAARQFSVEVKKAVQSEVGGGQVFTGAIAPQFTTNVSSRISGRVTDLMVKVGDRVTAGQPLAKIDTTQLQQQISQSEAALALSSANFQKAKSDQANTEMGAERTYELNKANLDKTYQDAMNSVNSAKQQVALSQANYNKAISDQQNTIASAKQAVVVSQQNLSNAINTYNNNVTTAQNALNAKQDSLQGQQISTSNSLDSLQLAVQQAAITYNNNVAKNASKTDIDSSLQKLQSAQLALQQAQGSPADKVATAQADLTKAQADLAAAQNPQTVVTAQENLNSSLLTLANAQNNLSVITDTNQQTLQKDQLSMNNALTALDYSSSITKLQGARDEQTLITAKSTDQIAVSAAQLQQAQNNLKVLQDQLQDGVVVAPVDGMVTAINTPIGQNAGANANILSLAAFDTVIATVNISEANIGKIKVGMDMKVNVPTLGKSYDGVVASIRPTIDATTKSYGIDIRVNDAKHELLPGMLATSSLKSEGRKAIMVPADAVLSQPSGNAVFIVQDGRAKKVNVKVGALTSAQFEITSGLKEGDEVVVKGQELLSDKAAVVIIEPGKEGTLPAQNAQQQGNNAQQRPQGAQNGQQQGGQQNGQQNGQQGGNNQNNAQRQQGAQNGQSGNQGGAQNPQGNNPAGAGGAPAQTQGQRAGGGQ